MRCVFGRLCLVVSVLVLAGCSGIESEAKYPTGASRVATGGDIYAKPESIFGADGLRILGGRDNSAEESGIGVNAFLWRAALDTISFMPLESADPFGGVILTGWYAAPETPGERMRLNVLILGRELRSDALRVRVFRQILRGGAWQDASVSPETGTRLEESILTRARELRIAGLSR